MTKAERAKHIISPLLAAYFVLLNISVHHLHTCNNHPARPDPQGVISTRLNPAPGKIRPDDPRVQPSRHREVCPVCNYLQHDKGYKIVPEAAPAPGIPVPGKALAAGKMPRENFDKHRFLPRAPPLS